VGILKTNPLVMPFHAVSSTNAYRLASNGDAWKRVSEVNGADMSIRYWGTRPALRKEGERFNSMF